MILVWIVKVSGNGKLIWDSYAEALADYREWRDQGFFVFLYPKIMNKKKLTKIPEFTGL